MIVFEKKSSFVEDAADASTRALKARNLLTWFLALMLPGVLSGYVFLAEASHVYVLAFLLSSGIGIAIIATNKLHVDLTGGKAHSSVQRVHLDSVPRIGGVAVFASCLAATYYGLNMSSVSYYDEEVIFGLVGNSASVGSSTFWSLCLCGLPVFIVGFLEDLTGRVGPSIRLLAASASAFAAGLFIDAAITSVSLPIFDVLLSVPAIALLFTCFAIAGVSNAFNIIDGFNGLSSGVASIIALTLGILAFSVGDVELGGFCLLVFFAFIGFNLVNLLTGKVFLGDGGAYFIGFLLAEAGVLLAQRNEQISAWAVLLVFIYPVVEVLFSMVRRYLAKRGSSEPDAEHLHHKIYAWMTKGKTIQAEEKTVWNSAVSKWTWAICALPCVAVIIGVNNAFGLSYYLIGALLGTAFYVSLYLYLCLKVNEQTLN